MGFDSEDDPVFFRPFQAPGEFLLGSGDAVPPTFPLVQNPGQTSEVFTTTFCRVIKGPFERLARLASNLWPGMIDGAGIQVEGQLQEYVRGDRPLSSSRFFSLLAERRTLANSLEGGKWERSSNSATFTPFRPSIEIICRT